MWLLKERIQNEFVANDSSNHVVASPQILDSEIRGKYLFNHFVFVHSVLLLIEGTVPYRVPESIGLVNTRHPANLYHTGYMYT